MTRRLAALALGLTVLSGCRWIAVGDSIFNGSRPELATHVGDGGRVDAVDGRNRPAYEAVIVENLAHLDPGGWLVVEDGAVTSLAEYPAFVRRVVALVPDDRCVAWVAPVVTDAYPTAGLVDGGVRPILEAELPAQPCHAIVDWDVAVAADPGLLHDGLHPSARGRVVLAGLIADVVGP